MMEVSDGLELARVAGIESLPGAVLRGFGSQCDRQFDVTRARSLAYPGAALRRPKRIAVGGKLQALTEKSPARGQGFSMSIEPPRGASHRQVNSQDDPIHPG